MGKEKTRPGEEKQKQWILLYTSDGYDGWRFLKDVHSLSAHYRRHVYLRQNKCSLYSV